jgi:maltose/moltooligosaccharide transporter
MTDKPRLSILQIINMSIGFMGIQFGWGLQMANMSAIYEYLGANADAIPILWLAAPLTGLLVQPIIGHLSDNTWCRLGRRRPYFLIGAILASAALFFMPFAGTLIMAASLLWILDTSVNISMEPFRAFVADMLPEEQRTVGYSVQTLFVSIGAVTASAFPWICHNIFHLGEAQQAAIHPGAAVGIQAHAHAVISQFLEKVPLLNHIHFADKLPYIIKFSFHFGAAVFIICVLWTIFTVREYPPAETERSKPKQKGAVSAFFREIFTDLFHMPKTMRELAWVQIFTWMGLFIMWMYFPVSVGHLFGSEGTAEYTNGIEWAGLCFAGYNFITFLYSFVMPSLARRISRKGVHISSLLLGAASMMAVLLLKGGPEHIAFTKKFVMFLMIGIGIAWGSVLTMPYAMLSTAIPKDKMGIYMGIFNFFITIPQIVVSLGFGWVMLHLLNDNRQLGVMCGGICWIIAALLTLRVKDRGAEKEMSKPESWAAPDHA